YTLVVAALRWARPALDEGRLLVLASVTAALGALVLLVATCARFARHPRLAGNWLLFGALLVPLCAYSDTFAFHATSGMDTTLAVAANALLVFATLALVRTPSRGRAISAAIAGGLAVLARP